MFINAVALIYTLGALIIFTGASHIVVDIYNPYVMASVMLIDVIILLSPPFIFQSTDKRKQKAVYNLQQIIAGTLLLEAGGRLGLFQLYKVGFQYDKLLHFIVSAGLLFGIAYLAHNYFNQNIYVSMIAGVGIILLAGIAWEILERILDLFFKSNLSGIDGKYISLDTRYDLLMDYLGIFAGTLGFWLSAHRNYEKNK